MVGASAFHAPPLPAVNTVRLGEGASRLLLPVLPGSDAVAALGPTPAGPGAGTDGADLAIPRRVGSLPTTGGPGPPALAAVVLATLLGARVAGGRRR